MKRITFNLVAVALVLSLIVAGCKKDDKKEDKKVDENGLTPEINLLIPDSIMKVMIELGMPINRGGTPPTLTGSFMASPFLLKSSNVPGDYPGQSFADYKVTFYEQDNEKLTIKVDYVNGPENGSGLGGFIVGKDSDFSIFAEVTSNYVGEQASMVHVISGLLKADGVHNLYFANFMVDNNGNPGGFWIANGQGRVIYDSDSLSPKVTKAEPIASEMFQSMGTLPKFK